jgi:hypothetical protein
VKPRVGLILAVVLAAEGAAHADIDYDKGLVLKAVNDKGDFELHVKLRIETLFDMNQDGDARLAVQRGRLELEGHAFTPKLQYKFQTDYGKGVVSVKDFYFEGEVASKTWLRVGQWKRPFSRQQMTSSGKLEMTTRAMTDKAFRGGRDIGIAIHDGYEQSPGVEWVFGVFDGTGIEPVVNPMTGAASNVPASWMPAFIGRIGVNHGGIKGYSEADLEGGPLRWSVAASAWAETDFDRDSKRTHEAELDGIVKVQGFSASAAAYVLKATDAGVQVGAHAQLGLVFGAGTRRFEPVVRYAVVVPDGDVTHELGAGIGWYPYGHNAKVLVDVGAHLPPGSVYGDDLFVQVGFDAGFF